MYYDSPIWPFGWGLTYTSFSYEFVGPANRTVSTADLAAGTVSPYSVKVTNTGSVTSSVSALAFAASGEAGRPLKQLFDFQRAASLAPGQSATLSLSLSPFVFATLDPAAQRLVVLSGNYELTFGDVSPLPSISAQLIVTGPSTPLP